MMSSKSKALHTAFILTLLQFIPIVQSSSTYKSQKLDPNLPYQTFPTRSSAEAAVVEWGNSAIISALDAAVASFGPQTSRGAFFEVEASPILADPIDGRGHRTDVPSEHDDIYQRKGWNIPYPGPLKNKQEVEGNLVVMTNHADLSGVQMARIAKESDAAALMVVNVLQENSPDYIYSLAPESPDEEAYAEEEIDIPVVMVSLSSGNMITTATVTEGMEAEDIVNNGMPERVRLYAADDRPFFEDVVGETPILYLIHNLLTKEEIKSLIESTGDGKYMDVVDDTVSNLLENTVASSPDRSPRAKGVEKMMVWRGKLNGHIGSQMEERIEQVTGYPRDQFSDWEVRKYGEGSMVELEYDTHPLYPPVASITVFLNGVEEDMGGELVFTKVKDGNPKKIRPVEGLAVVHHNTDREGKLDPHALHGELPLKRDSVKYVARKHVYAEPLPRSHRVILPLVAMLVGGGKLPRFVITVHDYLIVKFGLYQGTEYFEKVCVLVPMLILLALVQVVSMVVMGSVRGGDDGNTSTETSSTSTKSNKSSKGKKSSKKSD